MKGYHNKKLIRRWDSERKLSLLRHHRPTRTSKYNRLVHKFCHRSTRLCVGWSLVKFSQARWECLIL